MHQVNLAPVDCLCHLCTKSDRIFWHKEYLGAALSWIPLHNVVDIITFFCKCRLTFISNEVINEIVIVSIPTDFQIVKSEALSHSCRLMMMDPIHSWHCYSQTLVDKPLNNSIGIGIQQVSDESPTRSMTNPGINRAAHLTGIINRTVGSLETFVKLMDWSRHTWTEVPLARVAKERIVYVLRKLKISSSAACLNIPL